MKVRNRLVKNFSWSFIGSLIYASTQWLMLIIITRIGSAYDAGIYSLGLAISAPFVLLLNLNFTALQSTDLTVQYGFESFKRIRIFGNAIFIIIFSIVLLLSNYNFEVAIILLLIAISKVIESISELHYGLFQYHERLDIVAKSTIFRGIIGTLVFGLSYLIFKEIYIALIFLIIVWLVNLLLYDYKNGIKMIRIMPEMIQKMNMIDLLKIGIPLGVVSFLASSNVNLPRLVLEYYLSLEDLGYFSAIFYMVLIIGKFMTSLSSTLLPRMSRLFEENNKTSFLIMLKILILLLLSFSYATLLVSYYFGGEILTIFYGKEYFKYETLLVLIMVYGLFNYLGFVFEMGLNAMKVYQFRLTNEILVTSVIIVSSLYFIPNLGINGGAIALIISAFIKCCILLILFSFKYSSLLRGEVN